jgi:hypothetical protein
MYYVSCFKICLETIEDVKQALKQENLLNYCNVKLNKLLENKHKRFSPRQSPRKNQFIVYPGSISYGNRCETQPLSIFPVFICI